MHIFSLKYIKDSVKLNCGKPEENLTKKGV